MRRMLFQLMAVILWGFPTVSLAMTVQMYDFQAGKVNATWSGIGSISMEQRPEGLLLTTGNETGALVTQLEPSFLADMGEVILTTEKDIHSAFVWSFRSTLKDVTHSVPVEIDAETKTPHLFSLSRHPEWSAGPKNFGILFPPNATVLLHRLDLMKLTPIEKIMSVVQSFWTFDEYRPYSINFLWGPVLGTNPAEKALLYYYLPPQFTMGTWAFNCFLAAAATVGGLAYFFIRKRKIMQLVIVLALGMWLLLDLRMGSEFLTWVYNDHKTYIAAPEEVREFRDRDRFYDFAEFVKPLIQDRSRYIFFAEVPWPYLGNMRYLTYPILPAFNLKEDDTWVIYRRPDIRFTKEGQLVIGSTIVSENGTVLGEFDRGSFVFRGKPLPIPVQ